MKRRFINKWLGIIIIFIFCSGELIAQSDPITQARVYTDQKDYAKAIEIYKKLYEQSPLDGDVYSEYLDALITAKEYKDAESLVNKQMSIKRQDPLLFIDLGKVYIAANKAKKAEEQFDKAVQFVSGDDLLTTHIANIFTNLNQIKYAIQTYERAREILRNPYLYGSPLARLYAKNGEIEKAINAQLDGGQVQIGGIEDTKATMLELLGNDPKKLQQAQKALIKRINDQPENNYYSELLTWLYTQKDDWEGALIQIQALDERNREHGQRLLEFARTAMRERKYEIAIKSLDAITEQGKEQPLYAIAKAERLNVLMQQLEENPFYKATDVSSLQQDYVSFFAEFPQYYNTETLRDYATLEAQYVHNPQKAIELLQKAIGQPGARKDFAGWAKLQLGDYYILTGSIWDASLVYSQVDKAFREDMLGEEARFRNAKLAYYRGDFEWAQTQLSVLKASTSELIANDALYLSVLITENIPPDSNMVPLLRFAYADLLLFQNKDKEAEALLDSISQFYPKHPLKDDILMLRAELAQKHQDYSKALNYLKQVYEQYDKDVLADDAVFKTAELYSKYLKQNDQAKKFYEQLIVDYPGSTYVQTARNRMNELQQGTPALP